MIPRPIATAAAVVGEIAKAAKDSRPHTHCLRYIPGTPLGKKFPAWRFGYRRSAESCEATRLQCANAESIEVVEVDQ